MHPINRRRSLIWLDPPQAPPESGPRYLAIVIGTIAAGLLLILALAACGTTTAVSPAAATQDSAACHSARVWQRAGGTGTLAELMTGMNAIQADLKGGDVTTLQADGLALSEITGMDTVAQAPPTAVDAWASMVLSLNNAGQDLVGGDNASAQTAIARDLATARNIKSDLHNRCGI